MVNFSSNDQCRSLLDNFQGSCFQQVHQFSQEHPSVIRIAALPIAATHSLLIIASRISLIGESVLKGVGNLLGSIALDQCRFSRGLNLLIIQAPKHLIILPFTVVLAAFRTLFNTYRLLSDPVGRSAYLWREYDPRGHDLNHFAQAFDDYTKDPKNVRANSVLADCYARGTGTEQDRSKAVELYRYAAQAGDVRSMWQLSKLYLDANQVNDAMPWLERAANNGNLNAMVKAAQIYSNSKMYAKSLDYYLMASEEGHSDSMIEYFLLGYEMSTQKIAFDAVKHTKLKAAEILTRAALNGRGDAVSIIAFMIFLKCVADPNHPQKWDFPIEDVTKEEILNNLTPDMLRGYKKGLEDNETEGYKTLLLRLCPRNTREDMMTKAIVSQVQTVLTLNILDREIAKMQADIARREALYDAASRTQNPICMALAMII